MRLKQEAKALEPRAYRQQRLLLRRQHSHLRLLHLPIDHRRWGESSWLNYWQGRDEGLWVPAVPGSAVTGDTGDMGPGRNRERVLGGS